MSVYLIVFISASVLYVAFIIGVCYIKHCMGKNYELTSGISMFLQTTVFLAFAWWFLERFFSGSDSGFGWWLLAFALAGAISNCILLVTNHICDRIWSKKKDEEITTVKIRKGFKTVLDIIAFILCVGFTISFIYALISHKFDDIGEIIVGVLCIALFAFGSYDGMKKIIRHLKK